MALPLRLQRRNYRFHESNSIAEIACESPSMNSQCSLHPSVAETLLGCAAASRKDTAKTKRAVKNWRNKQSMRNANSSSWALFLPAFLSSWVSFSELLVNLSRHCSVTLLPYLGFHLDERQDFLFEFLWKCSDEFSLYPDRSTLHITFNQQPESGGSCSISSPGWDPFYETMNLCSHAGFTESTAHCCSPLEVTFICRICYFSLTRNL